MKGLLWLPKKEQIVNTRARVKSWEQFQGYCRREKVYRYIKTIGINSGSIEIKYT